MLTLFAGGCAAPHDSVASIVQRQKTALAKLPQEQRDLMIHPEGPVAATPAEAPVGPGLLTLEKAREVALGANPDIHAARGRLEAALARVAEARSFFFPKLVFSHNSTRTLLQPATRSRFVTIGPTPAITQIPPPNPTLTDILNIVGVPLLSRLGGNPDGDSNSFSDHSTILSGTWTLFDGFVREARLMSAKESYSASAMALGDMQRLVVQAVDAAYYQAQLGREQIRIAEADEQFSREQLADAQNRFEARKITKADVLNFEVRVRAAQADVVAAIGLRDTGRVLLAELLGVWESHLPEEVELSRLEEETEEELAGQNDEVWIEWAQEHRPDLAQARHTLAARRENILLARGQFSPEVSLSGTYGFERTSNLAYSVDDQSAAIGVEMRWQVFTGGFRTAQVRRAEADWLEAAAALEAKRLQVCADVRTAIVDLTNAQEQVRLQGLNVTSALENRRIVQLEYAAGKTSVVRLNEAQRDLVRSEVDLARSRIRLRRAWSDLRAAAGAYQDEQAFSPPGPETTTAPSPSSETRNGQGESGRYSQDSARMLRPWSRAATRSMS